MTARRSLWLLLPVLGGHLYLVARQASESGGPGSLLERGSLRLLAPVARLASVGVGLAAELARHLVLHGRLLEENRRLEAELEGLRGEALRWSGMEGEVTRLAEALHYARTAKLPLHVADIVYLDAGSWLQALVVRAGDRPARANQPVLSGAGLVGRVVVAAGPYAKVQLITDRAATVGALLERSRRQGVVRGDGGGALEMDFVPAEEDVRVGEAVLTSGIDGIYPRGIPVGSITAVEPGPSMFHRLRLVPAVDFGRLDQVYLLGGEPLPEDLGRPSPDAAP